MTDDSWHLVCPLNSLSDGTKSGKTIRGQSLLFFRFGDRVLAYEDRCPHADAPLCDGRLDRGRLTCRHHQWQFDVLTGKSIRPAGHRMKSYEVKIEAGSVFVAL